MRGGARGHTLGDVFQRDDYLERLIRSVGEMAARLAGDRAAARAETVEEVDAAYGELFGIPHGVLDAARAATVRQLVRADRVAALLELLDADAALAEAAGDATRAAHRRGLAAGLRAG